LVKGGRESGPPKWRALIKEREGKIGTPQIIIINWESQGVKEGYPRKFLFWGTTLMGMGKPHQSCLFKPLVGCSLG